MRETAGFEFRPSWDFPELAVSSGPLVRWFGFTAYSEIAGAM
jgi:hypothetical protein